MRLKNFSILFFFAYVILTSALDAIAELFKIDAAISLNMAATIAASFLASAWFSTARERRPTGQEIAAYAWQATLAAWLATMIMTAIVLTFLAPKDYAQFMLASIPRALLIIVVLIAIPLISLLYYVVIRLSFSWCTKLMRPA